MHVKTRARSRHQERRITQPTRRLGSDHRRGSTVGTRRSGGCRARSHPAPRLATASAMVEAHVVLAAGYPVAGKATERDGYDQLRRVGEQGLRSTLGCSLAEALRAPQNHRALQRTRDPAPDEADPLTRPGTLPNPTTGTWTVDVSDTAASGTGLSGSRPFPPAKYSRPPTGGCGQSGTRTLQSCSGA